MDKTQYTFLWFEIGLLYSSESKLNAIGFMWHNALGWTNEQNSSNHDDLNISNVFLFIQFIREMYTKNYYYCILHTFLKDGRSRHRI